MPKSMYGYSKKTSTRKPKASTRNTSSTRKAPKQRKK